MARNQNAQSFQDQWTKILKRLQAYQQEHNGSCNVPRQYDPDPQLATWVMNQRHQYKKGVLAKERCDQLDAIGFEWKSTRREQSLEKQWTKMFKRLQEYQQEYNGNMPKGYYQDPKLGRWVHKQRFLYKKGLLSKERFDQLEAIDFQWAQYNGWWAEMLKRLQAYQQEHDGSCNVPYRYPPDPQLGRWVSEQCERYNKGLLAKERCDQLEAIGFQWTLKGARASTQVQPPLSKVSKTKKTVTQEPLRWCWI